MNTFRVDDVVRKALRAIADRDWETLRPLLHPYLHWTLADGGTIRGRTQVISLLRSSRIQGEPSSYELRDGQIYRWTA